VGDIGEAIESLVEYVGEDAAVEDVGEDTDYTLEYPDKGSVTGQTHPRRHCNR
jgi:hypothetical protein